MKYCSPSQEAVEFFLCEDHLAAKLLLPLNARSAGPQDALRLLPEAFSSQCSPHWSHRGASRKFKH